MAKYTEPVAPVKRYHAIAENYTPGEILGQGAYGVTHSVTHRHSQKNYACKIIPKSKLDTKLRQERMEQEKEILIDIKKLYEPNLISTKEVLEDDHHHYIIMELCNGGTLLDRVKKCGPFREREAASVIKQVMKALEVCHKNGIVHRDMKLDNVMYETDTTRRSKIRLIDFGFATYYEEGKPLTAGVGSLMARAPEMLYKNGGYGPKVDIWSVGVMLFIMLIGKYPPWSSRRPSRMLRFFMNDFATFQMFPFPELSEGARDMLRCLLTIDVEDRWSASQVLEHPWIKHMEYLA